MVSGLGRVVTSKELMVSGLGRAGSSDGSRVTEEAGKEDGSRSGLFH